MHRFFVVANSIVSAYLVLSLALSIFHIISSVAHNTKVVLIFFDTVITFIHIYYGHCKQVDLEL